MTFQQNSKYALSEPLQPLESSKTIQQGIIPWNQKASQRPLEASFRKSAV
jgi:hypothetical protein